MNITAALYIITIGWWVLVIGLLCLLVWCVKAFVGTYSEADQEKYPCPSEYEPKGCEDEQG